MLTVYHIFGVRAHVVHFIACCFDAFSCGDKIGTRKAELFLHIVDCSLVFRL